MSGIQTERSAKGNQFQDVLGVGFSVFTDVQGLKRQVLRLSLASPTCQTFLPLRAETLWVHGVRLQVSTTSHHTVTAPFKKKKKKKRTKKAIFLHTFPLMNELLFKPPSLAIFSTVVCFAP